MRRTWAFVHTGSPACQLRNTAAGYSGSTRKYGTCTECLAHCFHACCFGFAWVSVIQILYSWVQAFVAHDLKAKWWLTNMVRSKTNTSSVLAAMRKSTIRATIQDCMAGRLCVKLTKRHRQFLVDIFFMTYFSYSESTGFDERSHTCKYAHITTIEHCDIRHLILEGLCIGESFFQQSCNIYVFHGQ